MPKSNFMELMENAFKGAHEIKPATQIISQSLASQRESTAAISFRHTKRQKNKGYTPAQSM